MEQSGLDAKRWHVVVLRLSTGKEHYVFDGNDYDSAVSRWNNYQADVDVLIVEIEEWQLVDESVWHPVVVRRQSVRRRSDGMMVETAGKPVKMTRGGEATAKLREFSTD
ncbi:hypothetical protein [Ancylobacter polymorphus]|uniref:DUF2849 domain-containing protein n=1 Tax=Ancylobacter polymorphus TaxID=223390 RepID=A0ABU0B7M8_9HYPH|nr:hypothetical protein [Ancylobacter polymorphus]MDQ0301390.1 hypothetical protein [Ancylobacter polymorphus]